LEGDQDFFLGAGGKHDEQGYGSGGAVYIIDPAHFDWGGGGDIEEGAADQVADVDFVGIERGALGERDGDDQAGQSFGVGDGTGLGKVEDDAALMKPVGLKLELARGLICLPARGIGIGNEPEPPPLRELFREVGEDVGEDFPFAALRAADAGQPDPHLRRLRRGHRTGSATGRC
jgi:hypothetical protein